MFPHRHWTYIRELVLFALGMILILDSVFGEAHIDRVIELTVGLVLVGVVPLDVLAERYLGRPPNPPPPPPPH